ncbi:GGDEF domain-containing protein [Catenovulum sediminis]|uniref:GGDEF domain-containing protein n=1 Tax=Catenovulum sediminis TaxID=1740262 RepID=UPI00117CCA04|nr:GGDEF domain-containing protein [Catenovulum sediminis]
MVRVRALFAFVIVLTGWSIHLLNTNQPIENNAINFFDLSSEVFTIIVIFMMLFVNLRLASTTSESSMFFIGLLSLLCGHTHDLLDEVINIQPLFISLILENAANNVGVLVIMFALFKWSGRYKQQIKLLQEQKLALTSVSNTDPMTHLYNRRFLNDEFKTRLQSLHLEQSPHTLAMIDLDRFKHFNDTYGHLEGDKLIQHAARTILNEIREVDYAFRFGGEEFLVVIKGNITTARRVAQRIHKVYYDSLFAVDGLKIEKSLSIGLKQLDDSFAFEQALNQADLALYQAKKQGRNCIIESSTCTNNEPTSFIQVTLNNDLATS